MPRFGEHRHGRRAGRFVGERQLDGVRVCAQRPDRGRSPLHLRYHAEPAKEQAQCTRERVARAASCVTDGVAAWASRDGALARPELEYFHRDLGFRVRHVDAALGDDLLEKVAHTAVASAAPMSWLFAAKRTSAVRAAPLSMARDATSTPSRTVPTRPATQHAAPAFISTAVRAPPALPSSTLRAAAAFIAG